MTTYMMNTNLVVEAQQYTKETPQKELVKHCYLSDGEIYKIPGDMMRKPKDSFHAVVTSDGFSRIELNDWIIVGDNDNTVIPNNLFKLLFTQKPQ